MRRKSQSDSEDEEMSDEEISEPTGVAKGLARGGRCEDAKTTPPAHDMHMDIRYRFALTPYPNPVR